MVTQSNNLNLTPGQISPRVNVSQYDKKSRTLTFSLFNGSQPFNIASGMAVTIEGTKPDNTGFQYAMDFTIGSNVVSMSVEQQMTVLAGEIPCEIVVSSTGKRLASANFTLVVEPAALKEDTIISETELPLIEEAAELAENIAIYVATIEADAAKAEGYAVGKQDGQDVPSTSPYYHNNAKYYKEQAASSASTASTKASNAATSASNASTSASNAATSATNAANSASTASTAASTATTKASDASNAAQTATTKANEASASAQAAQQAAASFTVDSATSTTSTNPVQNKVITGEVNSLKETLTNEVVTRATLGAHNLFNTKELANYVTILYQTGVTATFNSDDETLTMTSQTMPANVDIPTAADMPKFLAGIKPSTAYVFSAGIKSASVSLQVLYKATSSSSWTFLANQSNVDSVSFTTPASWYSLMVRVELASGATISGTLKMMIRLATDADSTYAPYAATNQQLTGLISNNITNGVVNMCPNNWGATRVVDGIRWTVNDDDTVTVDGTISTTDASKYIGIDFYLDAGRYKFSGSPAGGASGSNWMVMVMDTTHELGRETGSGITFTLSARTRIYLRLYVYKSYGTYTNLVFKPMITLADMPNSDYNHYVPYAMSNKELTDVAQSVVPDVDNPVINAYITTTTTWSKTGLKFALTKSAMVRAMAIANNGFPQGIAIISDTTGSHAGFYAITDATDLLSEPGNATVTTYLPAGNYEIMAKYKTASSNQIRVFVGK